MQQFFSDRVVFSLSSTSPMAYRVSDGETFWVETRDCYNGQFSDDRDDYALLNHDVVDAATGPIAVDGALPGDTLCVEVLDITLASRGLMVLAPGEGVLSGQIDRPSIRFFPIQDGWVQFSDTLRLPVRPMVGVLGLLPACGTLPCVLPGDHGANLDVKQLGIGATIYLPVAVDGGGLVVGDLHALMGDGELSGTGLETAGQVCLKVSVLKGHTIVRPIVETPDAYYFIASAERFETATALASDAAVSSLSAQLGLCFEDAYRLFGLICDVEVCQMVNALLTVRVRCPKAPWLPALFCDGKGAPPLASDA